MQKENENRNNYTSTEFIYIYINSRIYIVWSKIVNRLGFRRQNYLLYTMMIMLDIHDYGALF